MNAANGVSPLDDFDSSSHENNSEDECSPIISEVKSLAPAPTNSTSQPSRVILHRGIDSMGKPTSRMIKLIQKPSRKNNQKGPIKNIHPRSPHSASSDYFTPKETKMNPSPPVKTKMLLSGVDEERIKSEISDDDDDEKRNYIKVTNMENITEEIDIDEDVESKDPVTNAPPMFRKMIKGIEVIHCVLCGKNFPFNLDHMYRIHMVVKHKIDVHEDTLEELFAPEVTHECNKCNILLAGKQLLEHIDKCCPGLSVQAAFRELEELPAPKQNHHCSLCFEYFETRVMLRHHICSVHEELNFKVILEPKFRCCLCLQAFESSAALLRHVIDCTPRIPKSDTVLEIAKSLFNCDVCEKSHKHLEDTQVCFCNEDLYRCILCCRVFAKKETFFRHLDLYHGRQYEGLRCPFCSYNYRALVRFCFEHIVDDHYEPFLKARRVTGIDRIMSPTSNSTPVSTASFNTPVKHKPSILQVHDIPGTMSVSTMMLQQTKAIPKPIRPAGMITPSIIPIAPKPAPVPLAKPIPVPAIFVRSPGTPGSKRLPFLKPKPMSKESVVTVKGSPDNPIVVSPGSGSVSSTTISITKANTGNVYLPLSSFVRKSPLINSKRIPLSTPGSSYILQGNTLRPVVATSGNAPGQINIRPFIPGTGLRTSTPGNVRLIFSPHSTSGSGSFPILRTIRHTVSSSTPASTSTTPSASRPVVTATALDNMDDSEVSVVPASDHDNFKIISIQEMDGDEIMPPKKTEEKKTKEEVTIIGL